MSEREKAKILWKNIKQRKLVSKAVWDGNYFEWKCKGCDYAWTGNPDCGFVKEASGPDFDFSYQGKNYNRIENWEQNMLTFFNRREWAEKCKELKICSSFDTTWSFPSVKGDWKTVNQSNEAQGHWWRNKAALEILIDDDTYLSLNSPEGYEKVITPGWHQSVPYGAVPCPVCEDIYNVLSWRRPLNWFQKLKEMCK